MVSRRLARPGSPGRRGRPRKLSGRAITEVLATLPRSWPVDRIARELEARTGVRYHPGHVWRILARWGWARSWQPAPAVELCDPDGNVVRITAGAGRTSPRAGG